MSIRIIALSCVMVSFVVIASSATQITAVQWDASLGVLVVRFDAFPAKWGGWRMLIDGQEIPMEGGDGNPVARPNAALSNPPTGLYIGTSPWVSPLPDGALPRTGTIQFDIPGTGLTNVFTYDVREGYGSSSSETSPQYPGTPVGGTISQDTTWQGDVLVTGSVFVPSGVTVTILPGTHVRFVPYRGYKGPGERLSMRIEGTLKAVGTAQQPIWFTSAADHPQNGDWSMLRLVDASDASQIRFCILEFAQQGLNLWHSSPAISDVIVRWNNWEGIYLESYCKPTIERARIYQNGYNGIAMEQFNDAVIRDSTITACGTHGIHVDASTAHVESCILEDNGAAGLSVDDHGKLFVSACRIQGNSVGIQCGEGQNELSYDQNTVLVGNGKDTPRCPVESVRWVLSSQAPPQSISFPLPDWRPYELGYTPGDRQLDSYLYIYPSRDETREVIAKLGEGLGLTWSVAWDGEALWTATLWGDVYRLDPQTGDILSHWTYPGPQAWGMTYDGQYLWINDFAEKTVYQMTRTGEVVSTFTIPDPSGGAKGIAWDGQALCIMGWTSSTIYRVDKHGTLINTVPAAGGGGGITWDGEAFWVPGGEGIQRISPTGQRLGSIYACSEGTWDLAWDGQFLWACQRTNENWFDDKLYQVRILNLVP